MGWGSLWDPASLDVVFADVWEGVGVERVDVFKVIGGAGVVGAGSVVGCGNGSVVGWLVGCVVGLVVGGCVRVCSVVELASSLASSLVSLLNEDWAGSPILVGSAEKSIERALVVVGDDRVVALLEMDVVRPRLEKSEGVALPVMFASWDNKLIVLLCDLEEKPEAEEGDEEDEFAYWEE